MFWYIWLEKYKNNNSNDDKDYSASHIGVTEM